MIALTKQQAKLLAFIKAYQRREKASPSFDEMRVAMGLASKSGIHRIVSSLEERGYIRRLYNRARAIEVLPEPHLPETPLATYSTDALAAEIRRRGLTVGSVQWERPVRRFKEMVA